MLEDISCCHEKYVTLFQKGKTTDLHQAKKQQERLLKLLKMGLTTLELRAHTCPQ